MAAEKLSQALTDYVTAITKENVLRNAKMVDILILTDQVFTAVERLLNVKLGHSNIQAASELTSRPPELGARRHPLLQAVPRFLTESSF